MEPEKNPASLTSDYLALLQFLGEALRPVREDIQAMNRKLDSLVGDIERRYYSRDVIDQMQRSEQEQMAQLRKDLEEAQAAMNKRVDENSTAIKEVGTLLSGQWSRWLVSGGYLFGIISSIFAIIEVLRHGF